VDAYNFTAYENPGILLDDLFCLLESAGLEPRIEDGGKVKFYAQNKLILAPTGHRLLSVRSGGTNPHPFVEVKGEASQLIAGYARANWKHRPSRIDHAIDRCDPGLFHMLEEYTKDLAREFRLKWEPAGDQVTPDAGRTFYIGSRASQVFVRVYEKGLKYAHEMGLPVTEELRNWIRIELEFKPQNRKARELAPVIEPAQMWGSTRWTSRLSERVLAMATQPVSIRERRESSRERALRFMASQYRTHLHGLLQDCEGDETEFGRHIIDLAGIGSQEASQAA
jgi:hypothetical protein